MKAKEHIPFDRLRARLAIYLGRVDGEDFDILWYGFKHFMFRREGNKASARLSVALRRGWLSGKDALAFAHYAGISLVM